MRLKRIAAAASAIIVLMFATACSNNSNLLLNCYDFNVDDYIILGGYTDIVIKTRDPEATQEELDEFKQAFVDQYAEINPVEDRDDVRDGDLVNIDFTGYFNGEERSNMSGKDTDLEIGSGAFIDGFEEQLIGALVGSTVTITVTFPDDYKPSSELAGQDAVFDVTINSIYEIIRPEFTDELVAEHTDYDTVESYMEYIREAITEDNQQQIAREFENNVWTAVLENATVIKYPDKVLAESRDESYQYIESIANGYGMTISQYVSSALGMDMDEFNQLIEENARSAVKQKLVLYAIAKQEDIKISLKQYKEDVKVYIEEFGFDDFEELETYYDRNMIVESIAYDKIIEIILSSATSEIAED